MLKLSNETDGKLIICTSHGTKVAASVIAKALSPVNSGVTIQKNRGTQLATTTPNNASCWTISGYPSTAGLTIDVIVCFAFDGNPCFGYIYSIQITIWNGFYVHVSYATPVCYYRCCTQ
ncbi:unnamed protein product [Adineta ricciae]|uniref:Uncharacterized protein n=1 Tax=Adineta ricciae TaxID=249248 RepID=A0A816E609_ADIRI|nr:unnamed protein product [Adineta ricciae]